MSDWDGKVQLLRSEPSLAQIDSIIADYLSSEKPPALLFVTTLLNYTIPQTLESLPAPTQNEIMKVFQSLVGLSNLVHSISLLRNPQDSEQKKMLELYMKLLSMVFNLELIPTLLQKNKTTFLEAKEIDKLVFKGNLFGIINEIYVKSGISVQNKAFESTQAYTSFLNVSLLKLFKNGIDHNYTIMFTSSLFKLDDSSVFGYFDLLFTPENWSYFVESYNVMKKFQKREIVVKLYTLYINKRVFLKPQTNEILVSFGNILFFTSECFDDNMVERILLCMNRNLNVLISLILSKLPNERFNGLIMKVLEKWADDMTIKSESIVLQENRTHFIMYLLYQKKGTPFLEGLLSDKVFLDAISNRLHSYSSNVKSLGVVLADKVCEFNGKDPIFSIDEASVYLNLAKSEDFIDLKVPPLEDPWNVINQPEIELPVEELSSLKVSSIQPGAKESDDDSDDDSDSDDPTITSRGNVRDPLYIKDLLEYLTIDEKNPLAYDMRKKALTVGPTLLRQKFAFGNEIQFYSEDLMTNIVGLSNTFDDKTFESSRLQCMIAVLVTNPQVTIHTFRLLLTGDYSLQQRLSILSATTLAARELRGFKDEDVVSSFRETSFPSKQLPSGLHEKYVAIDNNSGFLRAIEASIQDELMDEASDESKNKIAGGRFFVFQNRIKERKNSDKHVDKPKINNFYRIMGQKFYFPLVGVGGSSVEGRSRVEELQIVESAVTGFLVIFDIMDEQYLITTHHHDIQQVQMWLGANWERLIDNKVKSLCAGLFLRISTVSEAYERSLMDLTNGLY
ncbi:hypothetical protein G9P44_006155 [Scheffersomyces stipitis]|nr:hypothetical protein G9P44_006155 [Scheffersomyces stipitis]